DTYSMHARHTVTAVVTGKPIDLSGSRGRREATGRGLLFVTNEAVKRFKLTPSETRVVVQGAGNVGATAARLMYQTGYKIVAMSDIHGGISNPRGLDVPVVLEYLARNGSFERFSEADPVSNHELLELDCDVLLPAATENQITSHNADKVKCRVLCE